MVYLNEPIPNCVPEYCREQQEKRDHQYELAMQREAHYLANRQKIKAAVGSGLTLLAFGGYGPCCECPSSDHDTMTNADDDIDLVICHNPACPEHNRDSTN